ncbi:MAG: gamma-glutamylcyclotransferase family protein [Pseudomonadota bacterium]
MRETDVVNTLFVYGSLRTDTTGGFGRAERVRLHKATRWIGRGALAGTLLDLGSYPGVFEAPRAGHIVGDVLQLCIPAGSVFKWLDAYEGLSPDGRAGEYKRVVRSANVDGGTVRCWVYLLRERPRDARVVASGDWLRPSPRARRR